VSSTITLRPYQQQLVAGVRAAFAAGARSVLAVAPTGAGKTVTFSYIAQAAAALGRRVCITVHRDSLLTQASDSLTECGVPHGLIAPGQPETRDLVQVASIQTLARRLDRWSFDFLIPDEAHHAISPTWANVFAAFPNAFTLGVTATPARTDGRGLAEIFEAMVIGPSIAELIADGYLVPPIVYGSMRRINVARVAVTQGDFNRAQLAEVMDTSTVTGDAIGEYTRLCPGAPAVAFCVNIQHAEDVCAQFVAAGYRAEVIHGKLPIAQIRRAVSGLKDGRLQVLVSVDLVSEGFDCPAITAEINLRPTVSEALYIQQAGRALRPLYAPGSDLATRAGRLAAIAASSKPAAILIDHADNWIRHGGPAVAREWTLEGRKKRPRGQHGAAVDIKQCPKCFACHAPAPVCPQCGHAYPIVSTERAPDTVHGQLAQVDAKLLEKKRRKEMIRRARTLEELQAVARELSYKPAWASILFQQRGGRIDQGTPTS
jgi:DNA repair protein RadD